MTTGETLYAALLNFLKERGKVLDQGPEAQLVIPVQGKNEPVLEVPTMLLLINDSPETKH
jgi:hypothetical protein